MYYVPKSSILLAGKGVRKISSVACVFSSIKIDNSAYPKCLIRRINEVYIFSIKYHLSLSHTEYGWAHGSYTVYSVIHGLTGTSIELQPCLGMCWYDWDSNVARVCTNKARIYSIKQGLSRFEHDLQNDFHTIVVRFQVRSSMVCYGLVWLNTTFTRLAGHLQGLHTVPPNILFQLCSNYHTFVYVMI